MAPAVEFLSQFVGLVGHCLGEVTVFADVLSEIVKLDVHILEELNQLEVPGANCARGPMRRAVIMRIMPVQRLPLQRAGLLQQRYEAEPVDVLAR